MEHSDQSLAADLRVSPRKPKLARWGLRVVLMICGLLMGAIILAQPRIGGPLQATVQRASATLAGTESVAYPNAVQLSAPAQDIATPADREPARNIDRPSTGSTKPQAASMPRNRVTVRRAGIIAND